VMMGDAAMRVMSGRMAHVGQGPVDEGEHILGGGRVEQCPVSAAGDVDGRGVREQAALPAVVVGERRILRTGAAGGEPGVALDLER
jgi:hypothetical protein